MAAQCTDAYQPTVAICRLVTKKATADNEAKLTLAVCCTDICFPHSEANTSLLLTER